MIRIEWQDWMFVFPLIWCNQFSSWTPIYFLWLVCQAVVRQDPKHGFCTSIFSSIACRHSLSSKPLSVSHTVNRSVPRVAVSIHPDTICFLFLVDLHIDGADSRSISLTDLSDWAESSSIISSFPSSGATCGSLSLMLSISISKPLVLSMIVTSQLCITLQQLVL